MVWTSFSGQKKVVCALANPKVSGLIHIKRLIEEGRYITSIDRSFALKQTAEAHSYIESRMNMGNVIIKI